MLSTLLKKSRDRIAAQNIEDMPQLRDSGIVLAALVLTVVQQRERMNQPPRLRHLHQLIGTSQASALRVVHQLEREGLVRIDEDLADRLAARIRLSPHTRRQFDRLANIDFGD